jgi:release factor glutamine methyltransferase
MHLPSTIAMLLKQSTDLLTKSTTARLDAEIILASVLKTNRTWLYVNGNSVISAEEIESYKKKIRERAKGVPVPYITGNCEFWSLPLTITPDVLIPRPETELLVEMSLDIIRRSPSRLSIADLGTGSGAVALAIASETLNTRIAATDISFAALQVAKRNVDQLNYNNIMLLAGSWLKPFGDKSLDIIVANPPYIGFKESHLTDNAIEFEPTTALFTKNNGMEEIDCIIAQGARCLKPGGWVLLEHGFQQGLKVRSSLEKSGYSRIHTQRDLNRCERITRAYIG